MLGYILQAQHVDVFSHSLVGSILFCLPVGILAMLLYYALRARGREDAAGALPARAASAMLAAARLPLGGAAFPAHWDLDTSVVGFLHA